MRRKLALFCIFQYNKISVFRLDSMNKRPVTTPDNAATRSLLRAIDRNSVDLVERALAAGADPNGYSERGRPQSLLCRAIRNQKNLAVDALIAGGADPALRQQRKRHLTSPPFVVQARCGPNERTVDWLTRFPSLHTPATLGKALFEVPNEEEGMFDVLLAAARALPRKDWSSESELLKSFPSWAVNRPLDRVKAAYALLPDGAPTDILSYALSWLTISHPADSLAKAEWLISLGADPLRETSDEHGSKRVAREEAIRNNRMDLLNLYEAAVSASSFDKKQWRADLENAIETQSRDVFEKRWKEAPLSDEAKRNMLAGFRIKTQRYVLNTSQYIIASPLEAACMGRSTVRIPKWVDLILRTCTTTPIDRGHAVHALCVGIYTSSGTKRGVRALKMMEEVGIDWDVMSPHCNQGYPGGSALEVGRNHKHLGPVVEELLSRRNAKALEESLPLTLEAPTSHRRRRL